MGQQGSGYTNDCTIFTVFPLGVSCHGIDPSTPLSSDGSVTLTITGGTPPYTVLWDNGSSETDLSNLMGGDHIAMVSDFYGDFESEVICTLVQPTTTVRPTPTTLRPTTDSYHNMTVFCLSILDASGTYHDTHLTGDSIYNGTRSWSSSGNTVQYDDVNSRWRLQHQDFPSTLIFSNDHKEANPPDNWIGQGENIISITRTIGLCKDRSDVFELRTTMPTITQRSDGSIVVVPVGSTNNFTYTIDGGKTYQPLPLFLSLREGKYVVGIKNKVSGNETFKKVELRALNNERTINLSLLHPHSRVNNKSRTDIYGKVQKGSSTMSIPRLDIISTAKEGDIITFDLVFTERNNENGIGSFNFLSDLKLEKNGVELTGTTNSTTVPLLTTGPCTGGTTTIISHSFIGVEMLFGDSISGAAENTIHMSGETSGSCHTILNSELTYQFRNVKVRPDTNVSIVTRGSGTLMDNSITYVKPPLTVKLINKWLTEEDSLTYGFPYWGDPNNPNSPGSSPRLAFSQEPQCLTVECFQAINTVPGGPSLSGEQNTRSVSDLKAGDLVNFMLDLGRIPALLNSCSTIKGELSVIINSGVQETLFEFEGGNSRCSKLFRYRIPSNASDVVFKWTQSRLQ